MKIQQILSDKTVNEGVLDDVTSPGGGGADVDQWILDRKKEHKDMLDYYSTNAFVQRALDELYRQTQGSGYHDSVITPDRYLATIEKTLGGRTTTEKKYFPNKQAAHKYAKGSFGHVVSFEKIDNKEDTEDLITLPVMLGLGEQKKKWMLQFPNEEYAQKWAFKHKNVATIIWPTGHNLQKEVDEGVLDDVRARMDARRNPSARPAAPTAQPAAPVVDQATKFKVGDVVEYWTGMKTPQNPRRGTITSIVDKYGGAELTVRTAYGLEELLHTSNKSQMIRKVDSATTPAQPATAPAAAAPVAEAADDFDASKIDPNTKCKTCGTAFKNHFTFDDNGKITHTLVRHMTMKDDFPGMPGQDSSAFKPRPGLAPRPTPGTSNLARPNPTPDLPRAEMVSTMGMPSRHLIGYKDNTYEPSGPYTKAPEGATGTRVLVPAAAFGIRSMGDVVALLTDDGTAYADQPIKVFNTYSIAKSQGMAEAYDPVTGLPASGQISEFEGDVVNYPPTTGTPTQSTPTTEQPPRRGYSIHLIKKPGASGANYEAKTAWRALALVFPRDYPPVDNYGNGPAQQKVYEVVKNGSAVVKSGIASEDIAETLVAKLVKLGVPYDCWEITSEDLNESVSNELQSLLKSAGIVRNK